MSEHCLLYCDCTLEQDVSSYREFDDTCVKYKSPRHLPTSPHLVILYPVTCIMYSLSCPDSTTVSAGASARLDTYTDLTGYGPRSLSI